MPDNIEDDEKRKSYSNNKAKETLERIRAAKSQRAANNEDSSNNLNSSRENTSNFASTPSSLRGSVDKRKDLLRQRRSKDRTGDRSEDDVRTGRQGPRSPLKRKNQTPTNNSFSRDGGASESERSERGADDDDYEEEDDDENDFNNNDEDFEEDQNELTTVQQPIHIFPLHLFSNDKQAEIQTHPLLVFPGTSNKDVSAFTAGSIINSIASCNLSSCFPSSNPDEKDILSGVELNSLSNNNNNNNNNRKGSEIEGLLESEMQQNYIESTSSIAKDHQWIGNEKMEDGLYVSGGPILSNILLTGDDVTTGITSMVNSAVDLSRVTQRTLRELQSSIKAEQTRKLWAESRNVSTLHSSQFGLAPTQLLRQVNSIPVLRMIEDPIFDFQVQPVIPKKVIEYGGTIGNWHENSSIKEKLGYIISSESRKASSQTVLRIHVYQISLSNHPLMNAEEKLYSNLKQCYMQYSSIFETRTTGYLSYRLFALITELKRLSCKNNLNQQDINILQGQYKDLLETLPALCELRAAIDSMSNSLYQGWKEIQEIRRRQGFVSTKASLTLKKITAKTNKQKDADLDSKISHLSAEDEDWDVLGGILETVPNLLKKINSIIIDSTKVVQDGQSSEKDSISPVASKSNYKKNDSENISKKLNDKTLSLAEDSIRELIKFKGLIPEYVLKLSDDEDITTDNNLGVEELKRREILEETRYRLVLKINGITVTSTVASSLNHPTFNVDFMKYFEFQVLDEPREVAVDIYSFSGNSCFNREKFMATVLVPLPGQSVNSSVGGTNTLKQPATHTLAPITGWFSFSSDRASQGGIFGRTDVEPIVNIQGSLLCTTEYDIATSDHSSNNIYEGIRGDEIANLPLRFKEPNSVNWVNRGIDFSRERDFQQLLPNLNIIDIHDPRSDSLIYLKSKAPVHKDIDIFQLSGLNFSVPFGEEGETYLNYMKFQDSLRMKLLKLRETKPFLFTEPIPLSEQSIKSSELYKRIIAKELFIEIEDKNLDDTSQKLKISDFMSRVRNSVSSLNRGSGRKLNTGSVVATTEYFQLIDALPWTALIPPRKRELRPAPKARLPIAMQVNNCNLLVQLVGAKNVPLRKKDESASNERASDNSKRNQQRDRNNGGGYNNNNPTISGDLLDESKIGEKKRARSYLSLKFQENSVRTVCVDGGAPLWKESVSLPFRAPQDDFTPSNLLQVQDDIAIMLFDEVVEDDSESGGHLEGENTERVEKRYLGSFNIPFSTVYAKGRIEGVFRIDTPIFNFAYDNANNKNSNKSTKSMFGDNEIVAVEEPGFWSQFISILTGSKKPKNSDSEPNDSQLIHPDTSEEFEYFASNNNSTYIKFMATLDPILLRSLPVDPEISISTLIAEDRSYAYYAQSWLKDLRGISNHTKDRPYSIFAMNNKGFKVLICRYLTAQRPPDGYESRRACINLVTLIPFMVDSSLFVSDTDLWCNMKQFFELGAGDEEEHGTTLYNFLYYLQSSTGASRAKKISNDSPEEIASENLFLVIGNAIPEGKSTYILLRDIRKKNCAPDDPSAFLIINPCTGHMYSAIDPKCPLQEIHCLATPNNIWANIQDEICPCNMKYDLTNVDNWRPFFGKRMSPPKGGIVTIQESFSYIDTGVAYALEIEKSLRQAIKNGIRRWRSKRHRPTTTFHPDASSILHDLLPSLEEWKKHGKSKEQSLISLQKIAVDKMKSILKTRYLKGFPLNFAFTDVDDILVKIKAMCIHESKHQDVQFVMAVRVFPIVNNIVSVWVFLGTLETMKNI